MSSVFSVFLSIPSPLCHCALCGRAFSRMAFPLSLTQGQRQNALKPLGGRRYSRLLELILQISSHSLPAHPFGALSVDVPGGTGGGEALV